MCPATTCWQVLIVEDDPVVASVYRRALTASEDFEVRGVVGSGEDAVAFLGRWPCDLMLLDLHLAGMNGVSLLQKLRAANNPIEVIALTATRNASIVRSVVQRGAIDYLVKPFSIERLHQALGLFLNRAAALRSDQLDQNTVDNICAAGRVPKRWLPKGLTEDGVTRVREVLGGTDTGMSSSEIARVTGFARVTARRYLEYLVATGQASVEALPSGPGRPRKVYEAQAA
jgi:response regulator of citrate/malate metabolism